MLIKKFMVGAASAAVLGLAVVTIPGSASAVTSTPAASGYTPISPFRALDTRTGTGAPKAPLGANKTLVVDLSAQVPAGATAVTFNLTGDDGTASTFVTAYPDGSTRPVSSNLNLTTGQVAPNSVTIALGANRKVDLYNLAGTVDLQLDIEGYFTANPAPTGPVTATASTSVSKWPESSGWANDAFIRVATIQRHTAVSASQCGTTAATCWFYTGTLMDNGSFTTVAGGHSPQAGTLISGIVSGSMVGGTKVEFYASSGSPDGSGVPATVDGSKKGTLTTSNWVEQMFPTGTKFSSPTLPQYSWVYTAPGTCEVWTDSINPGDDGQSAPDGDITGVNHCTG